MDRFMVVATFRDGTDMADVFAVRDDEVARVGILRDEGRIGAIYLSLARRRVFIEVIAPTPDDVDDIVGSLPMAKWWDIDVHPLGASPMP
jgi:muconolactone delta-isomerase